MVQATATSRSVRTSAQKAGLVLDLIRGKDVTSALATLKFSRPVSAKTWLQASNPSERWKWDFMFQDLPPVKFEGRHGLSSLLGAIPLTELK